MMIYIQNNIADIIVYTMIAVITIMLLTVFTIWWDDDED